MILRIGDMPEVERMTMPVAEERERRKKVINIRNMPNGAEKTWDFITRMGSLDGNVLEYRDYSRVNGAWSGQPCYVVGAGPSLKHTLPAVGGWEFFNGKHTIGINHVIEDYDGFEWFFFLDKRFLSITKYPIKEYKGLLFANCTSGMKMAGNTVVFHCTPRRPSTRMEDGLHGRLSGIAAVNLALIAGADPIYLFGLDQGKFPLTEENLHYKKGYTGERMTPKTAQKMQRIMTWFDVYKPYANRLRLVTDGGNQIPWMTRVAPEKLREKARKVVV